MLWILKAINLSCRKLGLAKTTANCLTGNQKITTIIPRVSATNMSFEKRFRMSVGTAILSLKTRAKG